MNVLTFDVEDWFHLLDYSSTRSTDNWRTFERRLDEGVDRLLTLLDRQNKTGTFFVLGWIADNYPDAVKRIDAAGHEIGTHSYSHQLIYEQTPEQFEADLKRSISAINGVIGKGVKYYRAPGFSLVPGCEWVFPVLARHGIEIDCSIFPAMRAHGGYAEGVSTKPFRVKYEDAALIEFPLNVASIMGINLVYSGGGYFRLLPYSIIRHFMTRSDYTMTYFHPRDFDTGQPTLPNLGITRRFRTYVGIKGALRKLERLLRGFEWCSVGEAVTKLENIKTIRLDLNHRSTKQSGQVAGSHVDDV